MRRRLQQMAAAYRLAAARQPRLPWFLAGAAALPLVLAVVVGLLVGPLPVWLPVGFLGALLAATIVFGQSVQRAQFTMMEGRPGAAAAVMEQMRGQWFVTPVVAANRKQDLVHRAVGRCGVVLVAEGSSSARAKSLLAQERKRAERIAGDAPVTTFLVGDGEGGTTELSRLQMALTRLPNELSKTEVPRLAKRYAGLDKGNLPNQRGYVPPQGRPR